MSDDPAAITMRWPGLRAKLLPVTVIEVSWSWKPWAHVGGNDFHGNWWALSIGRWLILGGRGTYGAAVRAIVAQEAGDE